MGPLWGHFGVTLGSLEALWRNLGLPGLPVGAKDAQKHVFLCVFCRTQKVGKVG